MEAQTTAPIKPRRTQAEKRLTAAQRREQAAARAAALAAERAMAGRKRTDVMFPAKLRFLFRARRYKVAHGGRGGAKSWGFARALILRAYNGTTRVLCAREFQNSITESVHKLLVNQIDSMGLTAHFDVTQTSIKCKHNGSEFIFSGIRNNVTKIKSMEGIDVCWVEEAEKVSNESWEVLIPTIRKPGSEIWVSFNPNLETDPTYIRFVVNQPDDCEVVQINWRDNPWFPDELRREMEYLKRVDFDAYLHVWEGHCRNNSDAQILRGKCFVESFEPNTGVDEAGKPLEWNGPYFGADWGFAQDPTTLVKCWIQGRTLYIEHEAYGIGVDIDATPAMFQRVPGADERAIIRADSARPETISYMQRHGFGAMRGVEKWAGSVEDGIAFLRSFERIVIHPRCEHTALEGKLWSYKVDKLTKDVKAEVMDAHNHCWDAVRYALQPLIRRGSNMGLVDFIRAQVVGQRQQQPAAGQGATTVAEVKSPGTAPHEISKPWTKAALDRARNQNR
jgi:phage terminase large subunit